jgi:hypothetical protein
MDLVDVKSESDDAIPPHLRALRAHCSQYNALTRTKPVSLGLAFLFLGLLAFNKGWHFFQKYLHLRNSLSFMVKIGYARPGCILGNWSSHVGRNCGSSPAKFALLRGSSLLSVLQHFSVQRI